MIPNNRNVFNCMYTKQKEKKRKAWTDGKLILDKNGFCHLHACSDGMIADRRLESRPITSSELNKLTNLRGEVEIDFENYVVQVEQAMETKLSKLVKPVVLKSFKVPQMIKTPEELAMKTQETIIKKYFIPTSKKLYTIDDDDDDIDQIWDQTKDNLVDQNNMTVKNIGNKENLDSLIQSSLQPAKHRSEDEHNRTKSETNNHPIVSSSSSSSSSSSLHDIWGCNPVNDIEIKNITKSDVNTEDVEHDSKRRHVSLPESSLFANHIDLNPKQSSDTSDIWDF